jgi:DNA-3-methyladenine glycosylase I
VNGLVITQIRLISNIMMRNGGVPVHDERTLFEFLILEGAKAGISWSTILNKRNNYRNAYYNFEPRKVAKYVDSTQQELLRNEGIVRNHLKVAAQ